MSKPLLAPAQTLPHARPAAPPASIIGHGGHRDFIRPASSIGLTYDRSHVTGASSSTASSQGFNRHHQLQQHPPSPATTAYNDLRNRSQYQHRHELPRTSTLGRDFPPRSHHGRVKNYYHQKPHNTTPASTDFEADNYSGLPSRTISEFQGGYATQDDSEYYGQFARQHPPTPQQVQSDFYNRSDDDDEEEYGGDFRSGPISDFHDDELEEDEEDDSRVVIRAPAPSPIPQ